MEKTLSPIISAADAMLLAQQPGIVFVDARAGATAKTIYESGHLEGAVFVDMDEELADIKENAALGGRHPLPIPTKFWEVLNRLGITPSSHVLVYDDKNASNAAARFWWMLTSIGHAKVQVIDGGLQAAIATGFKTSMGITKVVPVEAAWNTLWQLPVADLAEVDKASEQNSALIIDVRSKERYDGDEEPIDLVAGHIPGAINIPFTKNLDNTGLFLSPEELHGVYEDVLKDSDPGKVIVHCGSGVTACHTLLALAYAGFEIPKLYVGSWSEWSRTGKPIATRFNT